MSKSLTWSTELRTYKNIKQIGAGGNGKVYQVKDADGIEYALKLLDSNKSKAYKRFKDEIHILSTLQDKSGIIPLLDSYLPGSGETALKPFYVMPVAVPIEEYLKGKEHRYIYEFIMLISDTLLRLHKKNITHRDIKPANMLVLNGIPVLADFGLVNYPEQERASSVDEPIGAKWTIAPEMQRESDKTDFKKADVYSLAKSLWMLITKQLKSFEGQYITDSPISIKKYIDLKINTATGVYDWNYFSVVMLERLLSESTSNDPNERPDVNVFIQKLLYWYKTNDDFDRRNIYEWEDALKHIFPVSIPVHAEWNNADEIYNVLSILIKYSSLTHMFYPDTGGLDLVEVRITKDDCLELNGDVLIKPRLLIFNVIDNLSWSYFKLELDGLDFLSDVRGDREDVYELNDGSFVSELEDSVSYKRIMSKFRSGSFVITYKLSAINNLQGKDDGYNAYHSKMSAKGYRDKLKKIKLDLNKKSAVPRI